MPNDTFRGKVSFRLRRTPTCEKPMALGRRAKPRAETQRTNGQSNNEPSQHEPTNSKVGVSSTRNNWFCQNVPSRLRRTPCSERTGGRGLGSLCQASGRAPPDRTEWTNKHAIRLGETPFFVDISFFSRRHISKRSVPSTPNDH